MGEAVAMGQTVPGAKAGLSIGVQWGEIVTIALVPAGALPGMQSSPATMWQNDPAPPPVYCNLDSAVPSVLGMGEAVTAMLRSSMGPNLA